MHFSTYNPCHGGRGIDGRVNHDVDMGVHADAAAAAAGGASSTTHACRGCASRTRLRRLAAAYVAVAVAIAVGALAVFLLYEACELRPRYSVAINYFQCYDYTAFHPPPPTKDDCAPFHLTVRVASRSLMRVACTGPGTYVEVAYRGVTLATSASLPAMCAGPWRATDRSVMAPGADQWLSLPRPLLDSLAADVQSSGVQVFDITLKIERDRRQGTVSVPCGGRVVGDDNALDTECAG